MKSVHSAALLTVLLLAASCGPRIVPIMQSGDFVADRGEAATRDAAFEIEARRAQLAEISATRQAEALGQCRGASCRALARRQILPGMSESEVLAATGTTSAAWERRASGSATVLIPRDERMGARDAEAEVAMVSLSGGRVAAVTYHDVTGLRVVASAEDASRTGVARARADALRAEGDVLAAHGDFTAALDRYDRADVLLPNDPDTTLRIAQSLDKLLRPYEATMRYQLFIHQLEMERLYAEGEVAARIAEAIARARERVVILEQR